MVDYPYPSLLYIIDRALILFTTYIGTVIFFTTIKDRSIRNRKLFFCVSCGLALSIICTLLGGINNIYIKLLYIAATCIMVIIFDRDNIHFGIPSIIITYAISLCTEYLGVFLSGTLCFFVFKTSNKLLHTITACTLQLLLCVLISKIKGIKKCFSFLNKEDNFGFGVLISSYIFIFSFLLTQYDSINVNYGILLLSGSPLVLVGLILWIRSIFINHFQRKIAKRADEFTKNEIEEKNKRILQLETEVATLSKQLHRDNHLLSSLDRSVQSLCDCETDAEREQIINDLHTLYQERNELITKEQLKNKTLPSTGIAIIDASLIELYTKATADGIGFDLIVNEKLYYLVNNIISQTDLQTLLCDHVKDAIIAINAAENISGKILITIQKNEGIFEITVSDNGIPFETTTLAKLGRERITTHADNGGSGIGFMTTFETLRNCKGSLIIAEFEGNPSCTKSISFVFDGLNQFIISSYRNTELKQSIRRDDIIFF